jgi:tetratricopeptide (TPR) repeat protein
MRIYRDHSRLNFRRRRRRSGCLSFVVLLGVVAGVGALSWMWLERRLLTSAPVVSLENQYAAARAAFSAGDLDTAIMLLRRHLASHPADGGAALLAARALVYRSYSDYDRGVDRNAALQLTTDVVGRAPEDADALTAHAFALQAAGQPGRAAAQANAALELRPNDALARTALALAYGVAGNHEVALRESLRAAGQANTENAVDVLRALAITYADLGNYSEAARIVEQAMRYSDTLLSLYFERALYALQLGDADRATVAYYDVLVHDPNNVKARLRLCELSSMRREHEAALRYCGEVTTLAPAWSEGWYQLGREHFLQGDFEQAQLNLHRCSSLQVLQDVPVAERRFECWYLQGQAAQIRGDCAALVATYNEFRAMAAADAVRQTWTYPPEGPPGCSDVQ